MNLVRYVTKNVRYVALVNCMIVFMYLLYLILYVFFKYVTHTYSQYRDKLSVSNLGFVGKLTTVPHQSEKCCFFTVRYVIHFFINHSGLLVKDLKSAIVTCTLQVTLNINPFITFVYLFFYEIQASQSFNCSYVTYGILMSHLVMW